jgi:cell division protein ZapA (FtsZ GTPase activity inhibitor)
MKESVKNQVQVEISGITYTFNTDASPIHMKKMAQLVDRLMDKNEKLFPLLDQSRLAILAALQLADENIMLEKENESLKDAQEDVTESAAYKKLRDEHLKLREDYAKLRAAYTELKQKVDKPSV